MQPEIVLIPHPPDAVLEFARSRYFPDLQGKVEVFFGASKTLAWIRIDRDRDRAAICIHPLLNHQDTPREPISLICKHELLHLIIAPREIGGRLRAHPPEFFERERAITPERDRAWAWLWLTWGSHLRSRPRLERIDVLRGWGKRWCERKLSLAETLKLIGNGRSIPPIEDGW